MVDHFGILEVSVAVGLAMSITLWWKKHHEKHPTHPREISLGEMFLVGTLTTLVTREVIYGFFEQLII